ncbi:MAG: hypothetical protein AAGG02_14125 [Cyanobacteria bacterium P01_H01_bin.15]
MNAMLKSSSPKPSAPLPPVTRSQPTQWQMTIVLWLMVYPLITGLGLALNPLLKTRSLPVRNLVTTVIFVPAMVYGVVPAANKLIVTQNARQKR